MTASYEDLRAAHRWNVPARYNLARDVCDKHPRDKLAMGHERHDRNSDSEEVWVARVASIGIGIIAIAIAIIGGEGLNVSFMVGLAFAVAASANFPALLLALTWKRFNTTGAVTGALVGVISSIVLIVVSPKVWPGADSVTGSPVGWTLANPGILSIPLGFLGCFVGTMLSRERTGGERWEELVVRSETGIGAEEAVVKH